MPIKFKCPACTAKIKVPSQYAGKKGQCPTCKKVVDIPLESSVPESAESQAEQPVVAVPDTSDVASSSESSKLLEVTTSPSASSSSAEKKDTASVAFITIDCPGCGKKTGFPSELGGQPGSCPVCNVNLMIPAESGGEAFIIAGAPDAEPAPASSPSPKLQLPPERKRARTTAMPRVPRPSAEPAQTPMQRYGLVGGGAVGMLLIVVLYLALFTGKKNVGDDSEKEVARSSQRGKKSRKQSDNDSNKRSSKTDDADNDDIMVTRRPIDRDDDTLTAKVGRQASNSSQYIPVEKPVENSSNSNAVNAKPPVNATGSGDPADSKPPENDDPFMVDDSKGPDEVIKEPAAKDPEIEKPWTPKPLFPKKVEPKEDVKEPEKKAPPTIPKPPVCRVCQGTTFLPMPHRPYVWVEGDRKINPSSAVPWRCCKTCQPKEYPKSLVQKELDRLKLADPIHAGLEKQIGIAMRRVETHHVTLHAQMKATDARKIGMALEQLTGHLQKVTGTTVLTQTRPDTHQILIFWDSPGYLKYIDFLSARSPGRDFSLLRKASGASVERNKAFYNVQRGLGAPPKHMALHNLGKMLLMEATDHKAPLWLTEGFSSYCENAVTGKNLVYSFRYELNEVKFGQNWNMDIKKFARTGKLKRWSYIFPLDLIGMGSLEYLTCYSMVAFFMKNDPKRFVKVVQEIRDGKNSVEALEKVYARKISVLESMWAKWALTQY